MASASSSVRPVPESSRVRARRAMSEVHVPEDDRAAVGAGGGEGAVGGEGEEAHLAGAPVEGVGGLPGGSVPEGDGAVEAGGGEPAAAGVEGGAAEVLALGGVGEV